jgi:hypothetical protein
MIVQPLLGRDLVMEGPLRPVGAKFDQAEQNLVSLGFDLREGARSDLGMDAVYSFYWTSGVSTGEPRLFHGDEPEGARASSMRPLIVRAQRPHSTLQPRQP